MDKTIRIIACITMILLATGCSTTSRDLTSVSPQHKQMMCLAEAIHGEARGETEDGKIFVGRVVITRVKKGFGKNYCDVVYSKRQFAPKKKPTFSSIQAAKKSESLGPNGITHFHSYKIQKTSSAIFSKAPHCEPRGKVGSHWGFTCYEHGLRKTANVSDD